MSRSFSTLTLGLLVALTGCPSGDDTSTSVADGSSGTPATTGNTTEMSSADSTDGPATSSMTGATTDTPGTTTDEPGTTAGVDECGMCVEAMCADELAMCEADPDCTCFQDCAAMNPGIPGALQCGTDCGVDPLDVMTVTGALAACSQMNCPVCLG